MNLALPNPNVPAHTMNYCKTNPTFFMLLAVTIAPLISGSELKASPAVDNQDVEQKPNVVVFFIDDLGYTDLGCYGSTFHATPNIDRLAGRGVRMTDFYSANPVCSPTRAAMMTGKAPQRIGITQWLNQPNKRGIPKDEVTIGEAFQAAGYETAYFGKWHLGDKPEFHPTKHGFDFVRGTNRAGAPGSYYFPYSRKSKSAKPAADDFYSVPDFKDGSDGDYLTDGLTGLAIDFIEKSHETNSKAETETKQPFFLMLGHYAVHTPIQAPKELAKVYKAKRAKEFGDSETPFIEHLFDSRTRGRQDNADFGAMVENLDTNVGRVMDKIDELELTENTIIVFTSDNGGLSTLGRKRFGPGCCLPLRAGKGWTYEGGIRIPTIFSWGSKLKQAECSAPAITMDFYPTLLEMAGLDTKLDQHLDGISLANVLADPDSANNDRFLGWTYPHDHGSNHRPSHAARQGDWKLVRHIDDSTKDEDRIELFNLKADIGESTNVAKENPEVVKNLIDQLDQWLEETTPTVAKQ